METIGAILNQYWPIITVLGAFASWILISWLKGVFVTQKSHDLDKDKEKELIAKEIDTLRSLIKVVETLALGLQDRMAEQESRISDAQRNFQELNKYGSEPLRRLEEDIRDRLAIVSKELNAVSVRLEFMIKQSRRRDRPTV